MVHVSNSIIALAESYCAIKKSRMTTFIRLGESSFHEAEAASPRGLLLPPGIVQPFDLRFAPDDIHVIAYFRGHAEFEAVEAMIRWRGARHASVRAILTRHDQTQIDHVNDKTACIDAQAFDGRRTVYREVDVKEEGTPARPCVNVRFLSFANEAVQLRLEAASPPDGAKGGLTDPGRHAPTSSLPLMWRGKSSLAGLGTSVTINGVAYDIEERVRSPQGFVGLNGYYTESHQMGVLRASTCVFEVMQEPSLIDLGCTWIYKGIDGRETRCIVTEMSSPQQAVVTTMCGLRSERILAEVHGRCLRLMKVESLGPDEMETGFSVRFLADGHFAMDVAGNQQLLTGLASYRHEADDCAVIGLLPQAPSWATNRRVEVRIHRRGNKVEITSTVG